MVGIQVDIIGRERFLRALDGVSVAGKDLSPAFQAISGVFFENEERIFANEGDPEKFVPLPLESVYKRWKDRHYPGKKIMELTGSLKAAFTGKSTDTIREIAPLVARFGGSLPYARAQQLGYAPNNLPARRFVQVTEKQKKVWTQIILRFLGKEINRVFPK